MQVLKERLLKIFVDDLQKIIVKKLHTTQSNESKWINGQSVPSTEKNYSIFQSYEVLVDWILSFSDKKMWHYLWTIEL